MEYTTITTEEQYDHYCDRIIDLLEERKASNEDEIELLEQLIHEWEEVHYPTSESTPVEMLLSLMENHGLSNKQLADKLGVEESLVSNVINYKIGFSEGLINKLCNQFKMSQEAFNRPYPLKNN
ncbi:MAG: transcriptional regulator [Cytophagaceae bacterium]